jgi:hypothetical protein
MNAADPIAAGHGLCADVEERLRQRRAARVLLGASLPVDPDADARFAAFARTLVRPVPRVVLTPKPAPVKVKDHVLIRRRVQR